VLFHKLPSSTFSLFISLTITSFGFLFFYQRFPDAPSLLNTFTYDAQMYLNMVNEIDVPGPHSCRILLPYLAKFLPFKPLQSILIINIISFIALFYGLMKMLENFLINRSVIIFTLGIFFSTYCVAYNFTNPFLTDLPALATMIFYINSIIKLRFVSSLLWLGSSLLFRETAIVLVPLFFITFSLKKSIFASFLILLIYIVPKLIISGNFFCDFYSSISLKLLLDFEFLIKTILSYGALWIVGFFGFFSLKNYRKHLFKVACSLLILSLLGSVLSSFKSVTDVTRMYFLVLPTLILGSALFIQRILIKKYSFLYLTVLLSAGFSLSIGFFPNILINGDFSSLKEFARSNFTIIIISALFQFFAIALLVKLDLTNYYSSQKKFKS
jgi:hypothetical protein